MQDVPLMKDVWLIRMLVVLADTIKFIPRDVDIQPQLTHIRPNEIFGQIPRILLCPNFYDCLLTRQHHDTRNDQRMHILTMLSSEGWRLHANNKHRVSVAMTTATLADTQNLSDS